MSVRKRFLKKYNDISIVVKATLWFIVCSVVQKGIAFITTPIFTRLMSTEQYGQYSIYLSWLHIFTIITTLRLTGAVFNKGMSKYNEERDTYTSTMQTVTLFITIVIFCLYLIFHNQINALTELPTYIMVAIFAELLVTPAIEFWTVRNRYEYIYKPVVLRTLLMAVLNAIVGVIAVLVTKEKGYARIMSCIAVNFVFGVILYIYNAKRGKSLYKREYAEFAIKFNLPLLLHYICQYVLDQSDRIMVQKLSNMAAAGIYSVAYSIGSLLRIITTSINNAMIPWQYKCLEQREHKKLDDTMYIVFIVVAGCCFVLSSLAPEIMRILADDKYYEGVYVIPPVSMGLFFSFMYTTFANVEFFYEKNKFSMYISSVGAILNIVMNFFGIKKFGFIAAAYTTLICYILFAMGHYTYMSLSVKHEEGTEQIFNTKRLVLLSLGVVFFGLLIIFFYDKVAVRYSIIVGISLAAAICSKKIVAVFAVMNRSKA